MHRPHLKSPKNQNSNKITGGFCPFYLDLLLDAVGAGQDTMVYKIMLFRFCSQVNLKHAFVEPDL